MMSSSEEETLRFFQFVEDSGLGAYNRLVTQNLDHVWNEKSWASVQEKNEKKRKQEEGIKRTGEVSAEGKHLRMGSLSMPAPPEHVSPQQAQLSCGCPRAVRSQSLHSVGGGEDEGSPTSRKQPPPKPRRDPTTKLSTSSEAVDLSAICKGGDLDRCDAMLGCSEDCKRVPPPKPKRNPSTQLSMSFDEIYVHNTASKGPPPMPHSIEAKAHSPSSPSQQQESDSEEPVYIEMSGSVRREPPPLTEDEEPGEAVYEEMKYPLLDDFDSRWDLSSCRSQTATPCLSDTDVHASLSRCSTPRGTPLCDIPAPFPNLLTHRPPLLIFPPAPAQCSPNSDESPLSPMDMTKLPMLENSPYGKSPTSSSLEPLSSASTSHLRRAERELTATPTITASGRSSAPPLPCALYRSSGSSHGNQRSHSACPSPVSMGRCLTPLSLMRVPPFDGSFPGAGLPRSASATPHGKGSPPQDGGRVHGSAQIAPAGRSRTPTSPLDELTNLFTTGRNMLKKNSSSRKSKDPGESESKGRGHGSESKREHKERSHHGKESKRDKERNSSGKSSHRRESKDRDLNGTEALSRRDSKERACGSTEPSCRHDSKDNSFGAPELLPKQNSKDRGSSTTGPASRQDSKDRVCNGVEALLRRDSKDTHGSDLLPRQEGKDPPRNGLERHDSRDRSCHGPEPLPRHDGGKDPGKTGLECRSNCKEGGWNGLESRQAVHYDTADCRRDYKEQSSNGADLVNRKDCKDRGAYTMEASNRHESKEKNTYSTESPLAHERDTRPGPNIFNWSGRSPVSPTVPSLTLGNHELRTVTKVGRSPSTPIEPSPLGTPQRQPQEAQEMPLMPWVCGDSTMLEVIERKQRLCREIRSRQWLLERSPCKTDSVPALPAWKKTNGAKKNGPPPYPTQTTIFWDTAI